MSQAFPWSQLRARVSDLIVRGEPDFDDALGKLTWNRRLANARRPDAIVAVTSTEEVAATMRFARERGLAVSPRGGGHSYEAAALREGGIILDLAELDQVEIDIGERTCWVGAAVEGGRLLEELAKHGFAFPVGHCADVALSGYILSGGFGWNSGLWGPASANVSAIEMVLASGERVLATADDHADLFWAARGAGAGFFAVVTAYVLRLHNLPPAAFAWNASFTASSAPVLAPWLASAAHGSARGAEITCLVGPHHDTGGPAISLHVSATGHSHEEARAKICAFAAPPKDAEVIEAPKGEGLDFAGLTKLSAMPSGKRVACDHCWSGANIDELLLAVGDLAGVPDMASTINIFALGGGGMVANAPDERTGALSVGGGTGVGTYALWEEPADDERHLRWVEDVDAALAPYRTARYVGEARLGAPGRITECFTPGALARLADLRRRYDPDGLFPPFP